MAPVSAPRSSPPSRNQLLAVMSATDLTLLRPHLRPVALELLKDPERLPPARSTVFSASWGNPIPAIGYLQLMDLARSRRRAMALYVGLDVSLKTTSIYVVDADGTVIWRGKLRANRRLGEGSPALAGPGHPLSEWLYGALVESGFKTVCIETRHAQCFLLSGPTRPTAAMRAVSPI